jgi:ATP-dependent helicase/nuclease subunit A
MSRAAYIRNGQEVSAEAFYQAACDPQRSVVVEACAGAGKTWMLVSRILRALVEGVSPSQILAITFTRKAAGEMRERLSLWLLEMAQCSHEQRCHELMIRGMTFEQAQAHAPALEALFGRWLETSESPQISTIHGWFSRLVRGLPLDTLTELGLPAQLQLMEDLDELWPRLWGTFLKDMDRRESDPVRVAFDWLITSEGRSNLEAWLRSALGNRLELQLADQAGTWWDSIPPASAVFNAFSQVDQPLAQIDNEAVRSEFHALSRELGQAKGKTAQEAAQGVVSAWLETDLAVRFTALKKIFLTNTGEPRKRMGSDAPLLSWAQSWLMDLDQAQRQQSASELHRAMVLLSRTLFEHYARIKRDAGLIDITDLELAAARLHQDTVLSGWVQERLDLQVRHVLMDEFQDTSPLQWSTLHGWLSAYAGAGGGGSGQNPMRVFVVGDPKQSIYRFRRADPRVFEAAKDFVCTALDGDRLACDHTRRNAPGVIQLLNSVMAPAAEAGLFKGFRPHTTASEQSHQIRVLPEVLRPVKDKGDQRDAAESEDQDAWRDSLLTPRHERGTVLRQQEAAHCADAIAYMLVHEDRAPGDIYVLARKRASLAWVAEALAARGIAHAAPENTRLVDTPEARDLIAVMEAVTTPTHDLALAQALRSPALDASDRVLMAIARQARSVHPNASTSGHWWSAMMALSPDEPSLDEAERASLLRAQQLLSTWRDAARSLPPHDLMQQIVDDSDWRATLARRLSAPMLRQALSHLDALLGQALALHGGRDATPYRWLRELKRLREPLPASAVQGVVQLLTIHGAKGLEAPVVFMVDCDGEPPRSDHHTLLVDWPQGADHPACCAFVAREGAPPASLAATLESERLAQQTEECNALYVALTRARQELVFSRTQPHRRHPVASWWQRLWDSGSLTDASRWQPPPDTAGHADAADPATQVNALAQLPSLSPPTSRRTAAMVTPVSEADEAQAQWAHRGRVLHRVLELMTPLPVLERDAALIERLIRQAWAGLASASAGEVIAPSLTPALLSELFAQVQRIASNPEAQPWLDPEQLHWAGNEVVLWHEGQILRLDRLVARREGDSLTWWVLDYKLHETPHTVGSYRQQLERYVQVVAQLEPGRTVRGAFITGDGGFRAL